MTPNEVYKRCFALYLGAIRDHRTVRTSTATRFTHAGVHFDVRGRFGAAPDGVTGAWSITIGLPNRQVTVSQEGKKTHWIRKPTDYELVELTLMLPRA